MATRAMPERRAERAPVDSDEFRAAVVDNVDDIFRFVARRCGSANAEALTAEVFAQAFGSWSTFRPERGTVRQWMFGIASNVVRRHRHIGQRHLLTLQAELRHGVSAGAESALDEDLIGSRVDASHAGPALGRALATLRSDDRESLLLFAWEGLTYSEISSAFGVPIGTVRSRIHRARLALRSQLIAAGIDLQGGTDG